MYWQPFFNRAEGNGGESGTRAAGWGQGETGRCFLVPAGPGIAMSLRAKKLCQVPSTILSLISMVRKAPENTCPVSPPPACRPGSGFSFRSCVGSVNAGMKDGGGEFG